MITLPTCPVPEDGIVHQEQQTEAFLNDKSYGVGTLYIAESQVRWIDGDGNGFRLDYPAISIHAVSRDTSSFPHECLYMILDVKLDCMEQPMIEDAESDEEEDADSTEVRFVPTQRDQLDVMYQAMCSCQELHPDEEQEDSEDEFFGEERMGDGDGPQLSAQGLNNLQRMEQMLANGNGENGARNGDQDTMEDRDDGQFEDA